MAKIIHDLTDISEVIAKRAAGKDAKYPAGLPKKYQPVADEWRRLGWEVQDFGCFDYGDQLKLVIARDSVRKFALLHAECEEVVFDVLDTPWWASVQKRKEQEFQAAVNERCEQMRAMQRDIEAATEMNDVPLGEKREDLAAFEIHTLDERGLITVSHKIYADGRTEGFPPASLIINRIPSLEAAAFSRGNRWKS